MSFTVAYRPSATQQLAQIWNDGPDRPAITNAANAIDGDLRRDPFARSESRDGGRRIKVEPPLAVYYAVSEPDRLVEVKIESEVRPEQLTRYRGTLQAEEVASTCLVLLTRYPGTITQESARPDVWLRWYQLAEHLEEERARDSLIDPVAVFLLEQFLAFLRAKNMSIAQVGWELPGGLRALQSLMEMLLECARSLKVQATPHVERSRIGVFLERRDYWIGFMFDEPEALRFGTWNAKVNPDLAARLDAGEVYEWNSEKGVFGWRRVVDLQSEETHFFARSKASQMQVLEKFLRECLRDVRTVELRREQLGPEQNTTVAGDESEVPSVDVQEP